MSVSLQAFDSSALLGGATEAVGCASPGRSAPMTSEWIVFDRLDLKYDEHRPMRSTRSSRRASSTT